MDGTGNRRNRDKSGPARDYTNIGEVSDPAFVRLPVPGAVFAARSARFRDVAVDHSLDAYLRFLSRLTAVQHAAQDALPLPPEIPDARIAARLADTLPPLSQDMLRDDEGFPEVLAWIIRHGAVQDAPEAAQQALVRLSNMPPEERLSMAEDILAGAYPIDQLGESLYVAAALQVHLTRLASRLDASRLHPVADGVCPVCGSGPVASMIVGWADADRARYLCCSVCATLWNYVRIKCTACSSTAGISYHLIEEQSKDVAVETCTNCRSYIKHFHQHRKKEIDPVADDVASFGLDMLTKQEGFRRATPNPFLIVP